MTTKIVGRGGRWGGPAEFCRSAYRPGFDPSIRNLYIGFRVIKEKKIEYRVGRGGCWGGTAEYCRSAYRDRGFPSTRINYYGFRVIKDMA